MALIKCPECGGSISSNSKQCIHCWCKITACPECGKVSVGELAVCPECGYEFKKAVEAERFAKDVSVDVADSELYKDDAISKWKKTSVADNSVLKLIKFAKIAFHILSAILFVIVIVLFAVWLNSPTNEKLAGINDLKTSLTCLVAFSCILEVFDLIIDPAKEAFVKIRCSNWIRSRNNFDAVAYIRGYDNFMGTGQDEDDLGLFIESTYLSETPKGKSVIYLGLIVRCICAIALWACAGVCIMQNLTELIRVQSASGLDFEFKYFTLIGAAAVAIVYFCLTLVIDSRYMKGYKAWLNKTFPDWLDEKK